MCQVLSKACVMYMPISGEGSHRESDLKSGRPISRACSGAEAVGRAGKSESLDSRSERIARNQARAQKCGREYEESRRV